MEKVDGCENGEEDKGYMEALRHAADVEGN